MNVKKKSLHELYKQYEKCNPFLARNILLSKEYQAEKEEKQIK